MVDKIEEENKQLLLLSQACLGLITQNMNSICLNISSDIITIIFYLDKKENVDLECIEDIIAEFFAFHDKNVIVKKEIYVNRILDFNQLNGLRVFYSKYK